MKMDELDGFEFCPSVDKLTMARQYISAGDFVMARSTLDIFIHNHPRSKEGYIERGDIVFYHGFDDNRSIDDDDLEAALEDFDVAISIDEDDAYPYFRKSQIFLRQERYSESLEMVNASFIRAGATADNYLLRGDIRFWQGDFPGAKADLRSVVEYDPTNPLAHSFLGFIAIISGKWEEGVNHLNLAINGKVNLSQNYFFRGYCHSKLGYGEKAENDYSISLDLDPMTTEVTP